MAKALTWLAVLLWSAAALADAEPVLHWFKGNTHTHTNLSDGDSSPEDVVRWYRDHGYDFLVITDHHKVTEVDPASFRATGTATNLGGGTPRPLLIPGEEVTSRLPGKPLHVNAIGLKKAVPAQTGTSPVEVLQKNVDAIREAGGVPALNHPNFGWAFDADVLKKLENVKLVEIASGHPYVNMEGGGGVPSVEAMWDEVLTGGKTIYGIATDDAHHLKFESTAGNVALPGRAWVAVRAAELTAAAIIAALERGDFYASTGVELTDYSAAGKSLSIAIKEKNGAKYRTRFIGSSGKVLEESIANPATYTIRGNEGYVRAKVIDSNGRCAWTQPIRVP